MNDEILKQKINFLQAQMLDFNKRISPVKKEALDGRTSLPSHISKETEKLKKTCLQTAVTILKTMTCFLGPLVFPTVVYCIEGNSILFWQVMIISSIVAFVLVNKAFSILHSFIQNIKTHTCELIDLLKRNITEEKIGNSSLNILMLLILVILICIFTYRKNIFIIFYISLVSARFLLGLLTMHVHDQIKSEDKLPHHSPCDIKFNITKPSPPARKQLHFETAQPSYSPQHSPEKSFLMPQRRLDCTEQYSGSQIPNTPPPSYQESIDNVTSLSILNFSYLFHTP